MFDEIANDSKLLCRRLHRHSNSFFDPKVLGAVNFTIEEQKFNLKSPLAPIIISRGRQKHDVSLHIVTELNRYMSPLEAFSINTRVIIQPT
jgi:hypothetical protein